MNTVQLKHQLKRALAALENVGDHVPVMSLTPNGLEKLQLFTVYEANEEGNELEEGGEELAMIVVNLDFK